MRRAPGSSEAAPAARRASERRRRGARARRELPTPTVPHPPRSPGASKDARRDTAEPLPRNARGPFQDVARAPSSPRAHTRRDQSRRRPRLHLLRRRPPHLGARPAGRRPQAEIGAGPRTWGRGRFLIQDAPITAAAPAAAAPPAPTRAIRCTQHDPRTGTRRRRARPWPAHARARARTRGPGAARGGPSPCLRRISAVPRAPRRRVRGSGGPAPAARAPQARRPPRLPPRLEGLEHTPHPPATHHATHTTGRAPARCSCGARCRPGARRPLAAAGRSPVATAPRHAPSPAPETRPAAPGRRPPRPGPPPARPGPNAPGRSQRPPAPCQPKASHAIGTDRAPRRRRRQDLRVRGRGGARAGDRGIAMPYWCSVPWRARARQPKPQLSACTIQSSCASPARARQPSRPRQALARPALAAGPARRCPRPLRRRRCAAGPSHGASHARAALRLPCPQARAGIRSGGRAAAEWAALPPTGVPCGARGAHIHARATPAAAHARTPPARRPAAGQAPGAWRRGAPTLCGRPAPAPPPLPGNPGAAAPAARAPLAPARPPVFADPSHPLLGRGTKLATRGALAPAARAPSHRRRGRPLAHQPGRLSLPPGAPLVTHPTQRAPPAPPARRSGPGAPGRGPGSRRPPAARADATGARPLRASRTVRNRRSAARAPARAGAGRLQRTGRACETQKPAAAARRCQARAAPARAAALCLIHSPLPFIPFGRRAAPKPAPRRGAAAGHAGRRAGARYGMTRDTITGTRLHQPRVTPRLVRSHFKPAPQPDAISLLHSKHL